MRVALATALLFVAGNAFAEGGHQRELFDACVRSQDPSATQSYCSCTAERLGRLSEEDQLLFLEMTRIYARSPEPNQQQAQLMQAELRDNHRSDQRFGARLNALKQAAAGISDSCAPRRRHN